LHSKTEKEVVNLIGKPVRVYKIASGTRLAFYLGFRRGVFAIDPKFLLVDIQKSELHFGHITFAGDSFTATTAF